MRYETEQAWLLPFLKTIRTRPGMYLGHENVRLLWQYLSGYSQARVDLGLSPFGLGEPDHLREFTAWLRERHGHVHSTIGWYDVIGLLDPSERNIRTFFIEFDAYLFANGLDFGDVEPRQPESLWLR